MTRRVQIRRSPNSSDPLKLAHDQGYEKGLAEEKAKTRKLVDAAIKRARANERQVHLKRESAQQQEIDNLNQEVLRLRDSIETARYEAPYSENDAVKRIRKRLQSNDSRDWIAEFGEGDEPYVEDEEESLVDRVRRTRMDR